MNRFEEEYRKQQELKKIAEIAENVLNEYIAEDIKSTNDIRENIGREPIDTTCSDGRKERELTPNAQHFKTITETMLDTYIRKNADYGGSFDKSLDDDGLLVAKIRLGDKFNRFAQLIKNPAQVKEESLRDTLIDNAVYSILTVMWLDTRGLHNNELLMFEEQPIDNKRRDDYVNALRYIQDIPAGQSVGTIKTSISETPIMRFKRDEVKDVLYADNIPVGWIGHDGNIHLGKVPPGADMDGEDISSFIYHEQTIGPVGPMQTPTGISLGNDGNDNE